MKVCNKCGDEKELVEFPIDKRIKSGRQGICNECCSKRLKKYRKKNKELYSKKRKEYYQKLLSDPEKLEKRKEYEKQYREENNDIIKERDKKYREENKDKLSQYREDNKETRNAYNREYSKNNREYFKEKKKEYNKSKKGKEARRKWCNKYNKQNPHIVAWRSLMRRMVVQFQYNKTDSTINELGYSAEDLKIHVEELFLSGMSWSNYGEWHIDHTKSVSLFKKETPPSIVNALSNLKPMWATTREIGGIFYEGNLNKGNKLE